MPAKKGPGVDQPTVERVKALRAIGVTQKAIKQQLNISESTVRRYERRQDETPEQLEARMQELTRFVGTGWEIVHLAVALVIDGLKNGEIKPKDAAIIIGIIFDKIMAAESRLAPQTSQEYQKIELFAFASRDEPKPESLPDTGEVPQLPEPVQSDDMRPGGGEDLLRLPGGSQDGTGVPEIVGSDSSIDVPES